SAAECITPINRAIFFISLRLISPTRPPFALLPGEQFQIRPGAAGFDQIVLLIGLARMFLFASDDCVDLRAPRRLSSQSAFDSEKDKFGDIAKIKPHPSTVGAAVFSNLQLHEVGFVKETPGLHDL